MKKYHTVQEYVDEIYDKLYPRERAVVDAIKDHGYFIKYDLNGKGLDEAQGPRAIKDVEERGIPIERMSRIKVPQSKRPIARYAFGDTNKIDENRRLGRQTYVYSLKNKMIAVFGPYCVFCGRKLDPSELQIDHKLPVKYFGELPVKERDDVNNYQLVCKRCNKQKEKAIEYGCAKICFKSGNEEVIKSCYWYDPINYTHICMKPSRELQLVFNGEEQVEVFNNIASKAQKDGLSVQSEAIKLLRRLIK